jgi:hypothetical protein
MGLAIKRINWQLLLVHFLAIPFFILGARLLEGIRWVPLRQAYQTGGIEAFRQANAPEDLGATISAMLTGPLYAWFVAILLGCVLSALVVRRQRESAAIPVLLFVLAYVTSRTQYYESKVVLQGVSSLLGWFTYGSRQTHLGVVGGIFILLGLVPFMVTWNRSRAALTDQ